MQEAKFKEAVDCYSYLYRYTNACAWNIGGIMLTVETWRSRRKLSKCHFDHQKNPTWHGLRPNIGFWIAVRLQIMLRKWTLVGYNKHTAGYAAVRRVRKGTTNGQNSGSIGRSLWQQGKFVLLLQRFVYSPGGTHTKYKDSFKQSIQ